MTFIANQNIYDNIASRNAMVYTRKAPGVFRRLSSEWDTFRIL
jgi:hypothetical protein